MADPDPTADGAVQLDPATVSSRTFSTAFRGFDPVQVRAFLGQVADELRRLQEREGELVAALASGGGAVAATARPAAAPVAAPDAVEPEEQAPAAVADALVEEARTEADRILREARERVATLGSAATAEATRVLEDARADAARLRATATDDLKGRVDEAEASAVRKIAEAEREAASIRVKAREEADATIEAARERGREMVAEAQAARERMLADLAKRRRAAQAQLEQLRAGRDRLLDTLKVARRSIDEMTGRFDTNDGGSASAVTPPVSGTPSGSVTTTPGASNTEARPRPAVPTALAGAAPLVDERPSRPIRTRAVALGEAPPTAPRPVIAAAQAAEAAGADDAPNASAAAAAEAPPPRKPEERRSSALRILRRNRPPGPPPPPLVGRDSSSEGVRIIGRPHPGDEHAPVIEAPLPEEAAAATTTPAEAPPVDEPVEQAPRADQVPDEVAEAEPGVGHGDESGPAPAAMSREEIRPRIEDLFARIRADREATTASARALLAEDGDAVADPIEEEPPPAPAATASSPAPAPETPAVSDEDESRLQRRDAAVEPLAAQLTKRLKRALQDEQNSTLDRLRTRRGRGTIDDVLSEAADQMAPYRHLAFPFLEQAARAGTASAPFGEPVVATDDLAASLAGDLTGAVRQRLGAVLQAAASEELDLSATSERLSAVYREWKVQRVEQLAVHYLVAAHERGGFLAQPEGTPMRWLVDDEGPCPDCEDNALAGPTPRGEPFPTGQLHPPAHLGCRCLLTTASH